MRISIAKDFSSSPAGRFPDDGPFNGQVFRDGVLVPALRSDSVVELSIDGVNGFGSSFLEEAFGGLVRVHHFSADDLRARLRIVHDDKSLDFYRESIWEFIDKAVPE